MSLREQPRTQPGTPDPIEYADDWYAGELDDAKRARIAAAGYDLVELPQRYCVLRPTAKTRVSNLGTRLEGDTLKAPSGQPGMMIVTSRPNPAGWERVEHVMAPADDYVAPVADVEPA